MAIIGTSPSLSPGKTLYTVLAFIPLLLIAGCHYSEGVSTTLQLEGDVVLKRLAVVPFQQITPDEAGTRGVRCPICGAVFIADKSSNSSKTGEKVVENIFIEHLQSSGKVTILDQENVAGVYRRLSSGAAQADLAQTLKELGIELGAEGVVAGYVYRYREREGTPYSVKQPASVAFEIHLLRGSDGAQVWRGIFDRTQRSFFENILQFSSFFRLGAKWATAAELTHEGVDEILKTFPGLQEGP